MSDPSFPHLSAPLQLRHKRLKHRITFGAHTANMSADGLPGDRCYHYYLERAAGGAAMIVTEPVPVHPSTVLTRGNFRCDDDSIIPGFRRITEACHEHGAVIIQQLYHLGQHSDSDNSWMANWSVSGLPSYHDSHGSMEMNIRQIQEVQQGFVRAAVRAQQAGFDGVELFAGYSCLIDQFWAPWSNRRTDNYGGSRENRMRFSDEIIAEIRRLVGEEFIIGLALSFDPNAPILPSPEETIAIVSVHDRRGDVDYVSCGTGSYFDTVPLIPSSFQPDNFGPPFAAQVKAAVHHIRVQAESQVRLPKNAEQVIASGQADLASIVRGQIADPQMANKAFSGRAEQIRPCIACNQLCRGRRNRDYWISCLINPAVGREQEWGHSAAADTKSKPALAIIVGAGPAGLEAARTLAEAGWQVELREAAPNIGGRYRLAGLQPSRGRIQEHLDWYARELDRLGVRLRLGQHVDAAALVQEFPQLPKASAPTGTYLLLATGALTPTTGFQRSLPERDFLPGIQSGHVATIEQVLTQEIRPTGTVIVLDELGNWQATGTALHLQLAGYAVHLVTAAPLLGAELVNSGADKPIRKSFARAGGLAWTSHVIETWEPGSAKIRNTLTGQLTTIAADWLVLSGPGVPQRALQQGLAQSAIAFDEIGDCVAARSAAMAFYEGRKWALGKLNLPAG